MRIAIDARPFTRDIMGVGNFLKLTVLNMAYTDVSIEIYLLNPGKFHKSLDVVFPSNVKVITCPLSRRFNVPNLLWYLLKVPTVLCGLNVDVFYSPTPSLPFFLPKRPIKVITVHDVVGLEFVNTMALNNKISSAIMYKRSINGADLIWTNSEYTKEGVERYFPNRKSRDTFVGCSIDTSYFRKIEISNDEISKLKKKYSISDKFILFVGSLEPRKNITFLLELMPKLYFEHGIQLLVVGARGWKNSSIFEIVNNLDFPRQSTIFAGYVDIIELVKLYNIANCFVSTSLNEGFGMPQLEAIFCGCPVVTACNSAMIEVVQDYGSLVSGWDPEVWVDKIVEKVSLPKLQQEITMLFKEKYRWANIIGRLVTDIDKILRDGR
ncbi:MAG: glycosyltransferase family 1 protein [Breznakibacter sp.]